MKNKKVLMAESSDIYHDSRVQKEAISLSNNGYKVIVLGFRSKLKVKVKNKFIFFLFTLPIFSRKYRLFRNISIVLNIVLINSIIILKKANFYHAHNTMFLFGMFVSSVIHKNSKLIYDCHEVQEDTGRIHEKLERLFINRFDSIINVSKERAQYQAKKYDIPLKTFTILFNYPNLPKNISVNIKSNNILHFVFSGSFDLSKNRLDNFLIAIKDYADIRFTLFSKADSCDFLKLQNIVEEFGLESQVKLLPLLATNELLVNLLKFDFAVNMITNPHNLISYRYPAMNKMYEYLAAGLPILCSNIPFFEEEFVKRGVAFSVNPIDVLSIEEGLKFIRDNLHKIYSIKMRALELSKLYFNWKTQETKLLYLYKNLCKGGLS